MLMGSMDVSSSSSRAIFVFNFDSSHSTNVDTKNWQDIVLCDRKKNDLQPIHHIRTFTSHQGPIRLQKTPFYWLSIGTFATMTELNAFFYPTLGLALR